MCLQVRVRCHAFAEKPFSLFEFFCGGVLSFWVRNRCMKLLYFPKGVEVLLLVAVGVSYRRLLLLQFLQELEALLTAAAVPASVKR